jgi:hypothetical protein
MQANNLLFLTALVAGTGQVNAQGLLQTIITPEKAVATVNQALEGGRRTERDHWTCTGRWAVEPYRSKRAAGSLRFSVGNPLLKQLFSVVQQIGHPSRLNRDMKARFARKPTQ